MNAPVPLSRLTRLTVRRAVLGAEAVVGLEALPLLACPACAGSRQGDPVWLAVGIFLVVPALVTAVAALFVVREIRRNGGR